MTGENGGVVVCEGRDGAISVIRFISMLSIILCHFLQYYGNELAWWFNVGVQVFFVLSGFLYAERTIEDPLGFLFRTFKKILIPYYAVLVLVVALYLLFVPEEIVVINVIKAFLCVGVIKGMGHLWFVGYILVCYLITPYLYRLRVHLAKYSFKIDCFACLLLCGIIQILGYLLDSYFRPDRIACYILGYFVSYFYRKYGDRALRISGMLFFVVSLGSNSLRVFLKYIHPVNWHGIYATGFQVFEMYAHLALGVSIFLLLYLLLRGGYRQRLFRYSDEYAYSVYLTHHLFILSPLSALRLPFPAMVNCLIALVGIVISAVGLKYISGLLRYMFDRLVEHVLSGSVIF